MLGMKVKGVVLLLGLGDYRFINGAEIWDSMLQLQGIWACCKRMSEAEKGKRCSLSSGEDVIVSLDAVDSGPIFDTEPEQKVQNDDHYDVFTIECQHPEQSESVHNTYLIEQDAQNVSIESMDMNYDSEQIDQNDEDADLAEERELLAS
nr:hypothetical protein [Tanacetum cinerariifolium]